MAEINLCALRVHDDALIFAYQRNNLVVFVSANSPCFTHVWAYAETGSFANIYRKILFLAYDNAGLFLEHSGSYFVFEIEYRNVTVGQAEYMQYISTYMQTRAMHRRASDVNCIWCTCETHFLLMQRAGERNSKCVAGLFQWTTLLSKMYTRKTVKVENIVLYRIRVYRTYGHTRTHQGDFIRGFKNRLR